MRVYAFDRSRDAAFADRLARRTERPGRLLVTRARTQTMPPAQLRLAHKHFASQSAAGDQTLVSADSRPAAVLHFNMNCLTGGAQNRKTIRMHTCISAGLRRPTGNPPSCAARSRLRVYASDRSRDAAFADRLARRTERAGRLLVTRAHTQTMPPAQLRFAHKHFASQSATGDQTLASADSRPAMESKQ